MQSKLLSKKSLFVPSIVGGTLFLMIAFFVIRDDLSVQGSYIKPTVVTSGQTLQKIVLGIPVRLKIPKLKINASVKGLGLTPDGAMDVTKGPYDVAWYNLGPRPGNTGSAVIAGHYGRWKNGAISIFNLLNTLHTGDTLSITDDKGKIILFVVSKIKTYKLDADASDVFFSNDGKSHLNLITCIQDKVTKKYPNRLVVFTDKVVK